MKSCIPESDLYRKSGAKNSLEKIGVGAETLVHVEELELSYKFQIYIYFYKYVKIKKTIPLLNASRRTGLSFLD